MHRIAWNLPLADADQMDIIIWCTVLILIVAAGAAGVMWLRKYLRDEGLDDQPSQPTGFSLGDLRQHHREGRLTDEEFEKAKLKVVEAAKRAAERDAARSPEAARAAQGRRPLPPTPPATPPSVS